MTDSSHSTLQPLLSRDGYSSFHDSQVSVPFIFAAAVWGRMASADGKTV